MNQPESALDDSYYRHHVFVCLNKREDGACCADYGADAAFDYLKSSVKKRKLNGPGKVRVNRAGCLDRCNEGPVMVIYPEAVWYRFVDNEDIDEIVESHLLNGKVVERLLV